MPATPRSILILGASYGSLLGAKLALAGHHATLVCLPTEAETINAQGLRTRLPIKGRDGSIEIDSRSAPGRIAACTPKQADPSAHALVALAMQEPQYRHPSVRALLRRIGQAGVPVLSIMNMPPLPYLARLSGLDTAALHHAYTDPSVWEAIEPAKITLASPDPQAFRPPEEGPNVLQVTLATNFKTARFESDADTALLRTLAADIDAVRYEIDGTAHPLPVKLKVHASVFVPLAKWAMLLSGNYRCVTPGGPRAICEAVHSDLALTREVYDWVRGVCQRLGAAEGDLVPFEKYAAAAEILAKPSSAARALYAGAPAIERVDRLVHTIAARLGTSHPEVERTVALIDDRLSANTQAA
ncbi:MAG: hypothetical protein AAGI34_14725 [Pseudomonadota bacterium]